MSYSTFHQLAPPNKALKTDMPKVSRPLQEQGPRHFRHAAEPCVGRYEGGLAVLSTRLSEDLLSLGVRRGDLLLVHTAFSRLAPVERGPDGLIEALAAAIGPSGTLVMPSMSDDDDKPFSPTESSCVAMGVVANTFWRKPNVLRSDNPHAFAAKGPKAAAITAPHPLDVPHGLDSPVGRVYELDGQVLLLGVGHDANTTIHLAENLAGVRYRRPKHLTVLESGRPTRYAYCEIDHCCENFELLDGWLEAEGLQNRGMVGHAEARLMRSQDIVRIALARMRVNETVFLHPCGECIQCDEARESLRVFSVHDTPLS